MKILLTVAGVIVAFIFALSMAVLPVLSVHAQQSAKKFRIGFLDTGQSAAVPKLLTDLGYIDGQNAGFRAPLEPGAAGTGGRDGG